MDAHPSFWVVGMEEEEEEERVNLSKCHLCGNGEEEEEERPHKLAIKRELLSEEKSYIR